MHATTTRPHVYWYPRTVSKCRPMPYQGSALPLSYAEMLVELVGLHSYRQLKCQLGLS